MAPLGALPRRPAVGHGARGLQRGGRRLGLVPARPRPLARLPLGRGRARRLLRRPAAVVPRPGAVERPRPDPEGAAVRARQRRGQPRRGRQGGVPPRRRDADPLLQPLRLPLPAGGLPLRRAAGRERAPRPPRPGIRARRHRRAGRRRLRRRDDRICQGRPRRRADARDAAQRPRPAGADPRAADAVGAQHLVLGGRRGAPERRADQRRAASSERARIVPAGGGAVLAERPEMPPRRLAIDGGLALAVHRERDRRSAPVRRARAGALQGRHRPLRGRGRRRARWPPRAARPRPMPCSTCRPAARRCCA